MAEKVTRPGPKDWSDTKREEVLAEVAFLDRMGYSQRAITEKLWEDKRVDVTQPTVSAMLKEIRKRYREEMHFDHAALVWEKRQQYRDVRALAIAAYFRSMQDVDRKVETHELRAVLSEDETESRSRGKRTTGKAGAQKRLEAQMRKVKEVITREGRLPGATYLSIALETLRLECDLLGLNEPDKLQVQTSTLDWAELLASGSGDVIEAKLAEASRPAPPPENGLKELPYHNGEHNGTNGDA